MEMTQMPKFTFIHDDSDYEGDSDYPNAKMTVEFDSMYLQAVVNQFEMFLKGAGFVFEKLEVVNTEFYNNYFAEKSEEVSDQEDDGTNIPEAELTGEYDNSVPYQWDGVGTNFFKENIPPMKDKPF
jgi:hypothetical protein